MVRTLLVWCVFFTICSVPVTSGNNASGLVQQENLGTMEFTNEQVDALLKDDAFGVKLQANETMGSSRTNTSSRRSGRNRYFKTYGNEIDEDPLPVVVVELEDKASRRPETLASDIRCIAVPTRESFTSTLKLPPGYRAPPVIERRGKARIDQPNTCRIYQRSTSTYRLDVTNLSGCGVQECKGRDGEPWLCLDIRYPRMDGLRLPEDLVITIQCRPQDPVIAQSKTLAVSSYDSNVQQRSLGVISGGEQEFECEIGLFRQLPGTRLFTSRVLPGSAINVGEELQLRSIVRAGDGWNYSRMTEVRVHMGDLNGPESVPLVGHDGCRETKYKIIAPYNPTQPNKNLLISNFNFRAFMFENMESGDALHVSTKITACLEAIDCAPHTCQEDIQPQFQRPRSKRSVANAPKMNRSRISRHTVKDDPSVTTWATDIPIKIIVAGQEPVIDPEVQGCKTYLLVIMCTTILLVLITGALLFHVKLNARWKSQKEKELQKFYKGAQHPPLRNSKSCPSRVEEPRNGNDEGNSRDDSQLHRRRSSVQDHVGRRHSTVSCSHNIQELWETNEETSSRRPSVRSYGGTSRESLGCSQNLGNHQIVSNRPSNASTVVPPDPPPRSSSNFNRLGKYPSEHSPASRQRSNQSSRRSSNTTTTPILEEEELYDEPIVDGNNTGVLSEARNVHFDFSPRSNRSCELKECNDRVFKDAKMEPSLLPSRNFNRVDVVRRMMPMESPSRDQDYIPMDTLKRRDVNLKSINMEPDYHELLDYQEPAQVRVRVNGLPMDVPLTQSEEPIYNDVMFSATLV